MKTLQIAKPIPQFAVGALVQITKAGGNFGKPGALLRVLEDTGDGLVLTVPGCGGVIHATHGQVAPAVVEIPIGKKGGALVVTHEPLR